MRDHLKRRLAQVWPELRIIGEAFNAMNALQISEKLQPQIIFLDIRMPGQSGLEIANKLSSNALIVFVTAYDEYAVKAFEEGAIDYVLKPIDYESLHRSCLRIQDRLALNQIDYSKHNAIRMEQLLTYLVHQQQMNNKKYLRWIQASVGTGLRLISTEEILFFRAENKYTSVQTYNNEFLILDILPALSLRLPLARKGRGFLRRCAMILRRRFGGFLLLTALPHRSLRRLSGLHSRAKRKHPPCPALCLAVFA
ncbi:response regulator, partial [Undibacterium sp. LX40W]|nr:response regulator [Undibacterium nitidum]MBC3893373.1 response regulator [Undibacterium sp. LX40W]